MMFDKAKIVFVSACCFCLLTIRADAQAQSTSPTQAVAPEKQAPEKQAPTPKPAEIVWEDSPPLAAAVQRAAAAKKLLLIEVSTSWCSACREMEALFPKAEVAAELKHFILLNYDAEEGEGIDVSKRYNAITFPTFLAVDGKGLEVARITGSDSPTQFAAALKNIRTGARQFKKIEENLRKNPGDLALRLEVGSTWAVRGFKKPALEHLNKVVEGDADNQKGLAAQALYFQGEFLYARSLQDYVAAEKILRELREKYPTSPWARRAVFALAKALSGQKKNNKALSLLRNWAKSADDFDTVAWFCMKQNIALDEGIKYAKRAIKEKPEDGGYWTTLGALQRRAGNTQAARISLDKALKLDPTFKFAIKERGRL